MFTNELDRRKWGKPQYEMNIFSDSYKQYLKEAEFHSDSNVIILIYNIDTVKR